MPRYTVSLFNLNAVTWVCVCMWGKVEQVSSPATGHYEHVWHLLRLPSSQAPGPQSPSTRLWAQCWGNLAGGEGNEANLPPSISLTLTHTVMTRTLMHAWFHTGTSLCTHAYTHYTSETCRVALAVLMGGWMHGRCRILSPSEVS